MQLQRSPKNTSKKQSWRLFVVDHTCILPYGHNQGSVSLFRRTLSPYFDETIALTPRALPKDAARVKAFKRQLVYPYGILEESPIGRLLQTFLKNFMPHQLAKQRLHRTGKFIFKTVSRFIRTDAIYHITRRNWRKTLKRFNLTENDTIFFPSTDYYGAITLLSIVTSTPQYRPKIHLRMIGVMENAALFGKPNFTLSDLLKQVREARRIGVDISVSAETPTYASFLSKILGWNVFYFPYPLSGDFLPMPHKPIVSSLGSGRGDKGYFSLRQIIEETISKGSSDTRFEIQMIPTEHQDFNAEYDSALSNLPNVKLLPAILRDQEMLEFCTRTFVAILPYDKGTYALRGSAVYQEALAYGRPVVCLSDVGFAHMVEHYGNGFVCRDIAEFAQAINQSLKITPADWEERLLRARKLYTSDVEQAIQLLLTKKPHISSLGHLLTPKTFVAKEPLSSQMALFTRIVKTVDNIPPIPVIGKYLKRIYRPIRTLLLYSSKSLPIPKHRVIATCSSAFIGPFKFIPTNEDFVSLLNSIVGEIYIGREIYPFFRKQASPHRTDSNESLNFSNKAVNLWFDYFKPIKYPGQPLDHNDVFSLEQLPPSDESVTPLEFYTSSDRDQLYQRSDFRYWRQAVHNSIKNKIILADSLQKKVDHLLTQMQGRKIGVFIKQTSDTQWHHVLLEDYFAVIDQIIADIGSYSIFLATDNNTIIAAFKKRYGDHLLYDEASPHPIFPLINDENKKEVTFDEEKNRVGKEMIFDLFTAAGCHEFVGVASNFSLACSYLNPVQIQHVIATKNQWIPKLNIKINAKK